MPFTTPQPNPAGAAPAPRIAVIDYEFGNVRSVVNALETIGAEASLTRDHDALRAADGLILPGVGAFGDGMANLQKLHLLDILHELALVKKKPLLGICVGMQLMARKGYEYGEFDGLGWIDAEVIRLQPDDPALKIPHVGWNDVTALALPGGNALFGEPGAVHSYYFVHSYWVRCASPAVVAGACEYGLIFPAALQQDNLYAVQFHPEKSQKHGLALLRRFGEIAVAHAGRTATPQPVRLS
ncbi:MAG: imidazole glycerol phosphate synthase subunit HisH [Candidatus Melainabacteria bacterium]